MPKEIIGNVRQIYQIEQWLTNYDTNRIKFFNGKKKGKKPRKIIVPDISDDTEQKDDEVMEKTKSFKNNGGKYIIPIPETHII